MAEKFYRKERDQDFFHTCELVRQNTTKKLSVEEIVKEAICRPAKSFYIHPKEYANIIRKGKNTLPKRKTSRELHLEIITRYEQLKQKHPELKNHQLNKILLNQTAPRFYISISRGIILYYQLLKK